MESGSLEDSLPFPALQDPDVRVLHGLTRCYIPRKIPGAPVPGKFSRECQSRFKAIRLHR